MSKKAYLQFRWEQVDEYNYLCHYELVIPLRPLDIRRENDKGEKVRSQKIVALSEPTRRWGGGVPCINSDGYYADTPYRDGAHAKWDSEALGGFEIKVIALDGTIIDVDH